MSKKIKELTDIIYDKFHTEAACAEMLGWSRQRLNKITNGKKIPDVSELNSLSNVLDTSVGSLAIIFLQKKSPNEQRKIV
ncbi:helix-turn-helix transcriptional regulator [Megasphaera paucivorans]|uniref:Helix-turn-helix n=1 Tax=Megasphaera paucivorans TaxID=349095 RepID=A0A1G9UPK7_9FIRM|nr:helix-turn-helix transcriptional regulator [Megasphaera paucivorans]SDM61803.1 Helix-turn-helix [Megasphaera paucivorans]